MKIGELSARTGCPAGTIRFYESEGILPAPARGEGNQRIYGQTHLERLGYIMDCRANGMKLECIRRFLDYEDDPQLGSPWLLERVEDYLAQLEKRQQELRRLKKYLTGVRARLQASVGQAQDAP